ncbi:SDR family oxidoreductase [Arthrobacter sp. NPDC080031]|uniref:SDR family oxidoreductase n=1 Tax=Arthrobacter sp. NPDC080031 TaxID=3155918 RepID=UPI00344F5B78
MSNTDITRVALVTGAGQGIGRAIALKLAEDGYNVAVNDIAQSEENVEDVVREIQERGKRAIPVLADVSDAAQIRAAVSDAAEQLGRLDVAVANAGIARLEDFLELEPESWDQSFAINTRGVFLTWQAAARQIIAEGHGGKLIGAASQGAYRPAAELPAYSASKWAVRGLTQVAAMALASHKITVNSYAPGLVNTPLWDSNRDLFEASAAGIPLGRPQEPSDVADLVSFFASPLSDYMTGQTVLMDGGMVFS